MTVPEHAQGPILLCYDGSHHANLAIQRAATLLRHRAAVVVHVPSRHSGGSLAEAGGQLAIDAGFAPVAILEAEGDRAGAVILAEAHRQGASLIVAGSRGRSAAGSALLGSVSSTLVHHADLPVLVVRALGGQTREHGGPLLICFDASNEARAAVFRAADLLARPTALLASVFERLDRVTVMQSTLPWPPGPELQDRLARFERAEVDWIAETPAEAAATASAAGLEAREVQIEWHGMPWTALLHVANVADASCIVVGHRPTTMHLGSTAYGLVHHAHRPILVVPGSTTRG